MTIAIDTLATGIAAASPTGAGVAVMHPLVSLWQGADVVTRSSVILLLAMFLLSAYVVLDRSIRQFVHARHSRTVAVAFWSAPNLYDALKQLEPESPFRRIAQAGVEAAAHLDSRLADQIQSREWIPLSIDRAVRELGYSCQERLGVLGMIAPVAMVVGLTGGIWALHGALIGFADNGRVEDLAPRTGEALLVIGLGFAVALTATAGYNWLLRRNAEIVDRAREFASEIQALLLSADRSVSDDSDSAESPVLMTPAGRIRAGTSAR